ncbi:hydrogenase maturation protease (plasmid) [Lichenicola cladoniae]|uniref:Hydrogenase maturation protease n=1 Tax=Lichenicola cladoniae TaxID=1484109 RepID=A0A6M8HYB8_9PROT|nr:hydrogenase maturation protease [Lichenicola cladoniae]NPD68185.1 hydrogenase maturation protease [Acetobacteraceae bacterium]QKE93564.1 hydrogenase maturation protease [Lichenicola cladoniae]
MDLSSPVTPPRILVLGYGNPGRQDDGLGPAASTRIDEMGLPNVTAYDNYQLNIEDAMDVAEHDVVWFVDAARVGPAPFSVRDLHPVAAIEFTSHLMGPETVLSIAEQVFGRVPKAFLLAIRGYEFEFIEALTPDASDNLRLALEMLTDRIGAPVAAARAS